MESVEIIRKTHTDAIKKHSRVVNNRISSENSTEQREKERGVRIVHRNDVSQRISERTVPLYSKLYSQRNDTRGMLASIITGGITSRHAGATAMTAYMRMCIYRGRSRSGKRRDPRSSTDLARNLNATEYFPRPLPKFYSRLTRDTTVSVQ